MRKVTVGCMGCHMVVGPPPAAVRGLEHGLVGNLETGTAILTAGTGTAIPTAGTVTTAGTETCTRSASTRTSPTQATPTAPIRMPPTPTATPRIRTHITPIRTLTLALPPRDGRRPTGSGKSI